MPSTWPQPTSTSTLFKAAERRHKVSKFESMESLWARCVHYRHAEMRCNLSVPAKRPVGRFSKSGARKEDYRCQQHSYVAPGRERPQERQHTHTSRTPRRSSRPSGLPARRRSPSACRTGTSCLDSRAPPATHRWRLRVCVQQCAISLEPRFSQPQGELRVNVRPAQPRLTLPTQRHRWRGPRRYHPPASLSINVPMLCGCPSGTGSAMRTPAHTKPSAYRQA